MSVVVQVSLSNGKELFNLEIQNTGVFQPTGINTYTVFRIAEIAHPESRVPVGEIEHNRGEGAEVLVGKAFELLNRRKL